MQHKGVTIYVLESTDAQPLFFDVAVKERVRCTFRFKNLNFFFIGNVYRSHCSDKLQYIDAFRDNLLSLDHNQFE